MEVEAIIWTVIGFGMLGLVSIIIWQFKNLFGNQKEIIKSIQEINIKLAGDDAAEDILRKQNDEKHDALRLSMSELAGDMSTMAKNITSNFLDLKEHRIRISNLEDQHKITAEILRKLSA